MKGRSAFRHSLEKGSFGESYTNNCNWSFAGIGLPDGARCGAERSPTPDAASLRCGWAVPGEPDHFRLLRYALATLAAGSDGSKVEGRRGSRGGTTARGCCSICDAADGARRPQGAAAKCADGRSADAAWLEWRSVLSERSWCAIGSARRTAGRPAAWGTWVPVGASDHAADSATRTARTACAAEYGADVPQRAVDLAAQSQWY